MKNVAKFEETRKALEAFKERTEYLFEEADNKLEQKSAESKVYQRAFLKALRTTQLTINQRRNVVSFEGEGLGSCIQPIYTKKRRINVIPLCFMVQLYKESIVDVPEAKTSEIPFTLTGFWSMEKTQDCMLALMKLKTRQSRVLLSSTNEIDFIGNKEEARKLLRTIEGVKVSNVEDGFLKLSYNDDFFKLNGRNTKVNVVPLCKIVCKYYFDVVNGLEDMRINEKGEKTKFRIQHMQNEFRAFVEKYFISEMLRR